MGHPQARHTLQYVSRDNENTPLLGRLKKAWVELANRVSPPPDPSLVTAGHYLCDPREMVWQRRATGGRSDNCSPLDQRIHPFHECLRSWKHSDHPFDLRPSDQPSSLLYLLPNFVCDLLTFKNLASPSSFTSPLFLSIPSTPHQTFTSNLIHPQVTLHLTAGNGIFRRLNSIYIKPNCKKVE